MEVWEWGFMAYMVNAYYVCGEVLFGWVGVGGSKWSGVS